VASDLFEGFPREIGSPKTAGMRQIVHSIDELLEYVNTQNGYNDVFVSCYAFREVQNIEEGRVRINYRTAVVDKIFVDLDGTRKSGEDKNPQRAHDDAQIIHRWGRNNGYLHIVLYSGNCYQLYFFIKQNLKNPSIAIKNFLAHLASQLGVLIDPKIRGNLAQLVRYPDTYNPSGRRYCISLADFKSLTHRKIRRIAKQQMHTITLYGKELLDISQWDKEMPFVGERVEPIKWTPELEERMTAAMEKFKKLDVPPCIKRLMSIPTLGYEGRWIVIVYLCERGVPREVAHKILQGFLTPEKFRHCTQDEAYSYGGMINYIFARAAHDEEDGGYYMWACKKMREYGYCVEGCKRTHPCYK
jgi:hypothetical protein